MHSSNSSSSPVAPVKTEFYFSFNNIQHITMYSGKLTLFF
jgi:hypothetical protein